MTAISRLNLFPVTTFFTIAVPTENIGECKLSFAQNASLIFACVVVGGVHLSVSSVANAIPHEAAHDGFPTTRFPTTRAPTIAVTVTDVPTTSATVSPTVGTFPPTVATASPTVTTTAPTTARPTNTGDTKPPTLLPTNPLWCPLQNPLCCKRCNHDGESSNNDEKSAATI